MFQDMTVTRPDGSTAVEGMASLAGTFRLVLAGLDWSNMDVVASALGLVEREARAELMRPIPGQC